MCGCSKNSIYTNSAQTIKQRLVTHKVCLWVSDCLGRMADLAVLGLCLEPGPLIQP